MHSCILLPAKQPEYVICKQVKSITCQANGRKHAKYGQFLQIICQKHNADSHCQEAHGPHQECHIGNLKDTCHKKTYNRNCNADSQNSNSFSPACIGDGTLKAGLGQQYAYRESKHMYDNALVLRQECKGNRSTGKSANYPGCFIFHQFENQPKCPIPGKNQV